MFYYMQYMILINDFLKCLCFHKFNSEKQLHFSFKMTLVSYNIVLKLEWMYIILYEIFPQ